MTRNPVILVTALVAAAALAGCIGEYSASQDWNGQSMTYKTPTSYSRAEQWNAPELAGEDESWENPFGAARFDFSGQIGPGRVKIEVKDADGDLVAGFETYGPWQGAEGGNTATGEPGTWTVTVTKQSASGQMALSLQSV